jgi:hypothetical protein
VSRPGPAARSSRDDRGGEIVANSIEPVEKNSSRPCIGKVSSEELAKKSASPRRHDIDSRTAHPPNAIKARAKTPTSHRIELCGAKY